MLIGSILEKAKRLFPNAEAVCCQERKFSYRELYERCSKLSNFFKSLQIEKGDRVAIAHKNCHHYLEAYFASALRGAILCSINTRLSPKEIYYILHDSGAKILLGDKDISQKLEEATQKLPVKVIYTCELEEAVENFDPEPEEVPSLNPEDPAHLYYTSGTTGKPKGVILTHRNVTYHSLMTIAELGITGKDVWLHAAPMFHLADAWATFAITWVGGKHVMLGKFEPEKVLETFQKEKITITNMVPTMYNMLVNHQNIDKYDYKSLRLLLSGGAPMPFELARKIMETFGCEYVQTYGLTETSPYLTISKPKAHMKLSREEEIRLRSRTGREMMGVMLKVIREDGREVRWNDKEVGEVVVRGPTVTPGYWNLPEETKKAFKDGWFCTGDLATVNEEGYINIVDRKKDMIITGGENVYSTEVENVIYMHPGVYEVAVIGVPDEIWGEAVRAVVVPKPGAKLTEQEIIDFCKKHLAGYKVPKKVDFVKELPKTGSGKIAKRIIRSWYEK